MSDKQLHIPQAMRSVLHERASVNWGFVVASVISFVIFLSAGWAQTPSHTVKGDYFNYTQHNVHPTSGDFRYDRNSLTGTQVPTIWEAAQERKQERDGKDDVVNPPHSYLITVAVNIHERKSQFAQLRLKSETPGVSLVVLHHSWKGYLS
jgi:hypothetical protein